MCHGSPGGSSAAVELDEQHANAETEAVDLLIEIEQLEWLEQYVDADNFRRTCLYLTSTSAYLPEPDDRHVLHTAYAIYMKVCFG